ncbi:MAG: hypothetical protein RR720_22490, partial [Comamonas sp.]
RMGLLEQVPGNGARCGFEVRSKSVHCTDECKEQQRRRSREGLAPFFMGQERFAHLLMRKNALAA